MTMASNQKSTTMVAPFCQEQKVASVKYSNIKVSITRKYLQNISFWAYKTQTGIFHYAPVTAITFGLINDTLAMSVGMDKKLVCCEWENPLASSTFYIDGVSMAVGTSRGKVGIFHP